MKLDKNKFDLLLGNWIKWDGDLWAVLREIELKLLFDRIVTEMNDADLAKNYRTTPEKIREFLAVIYFKIEKSHGKKLAGLIRQIDAHVQAKAQGKNEKPEQGFDFEKVFLN
ncbi:MAG: hypothetical protein HYZ14_03110 [Bacteroidetes bacterium]|nr:hypothetical protein [Bacteroidota bacterium]